MGSALGGDANPQPWWDIFGFSCCAGDRSGDIDDDDAKQVKENPVSPKKSPSKLSSVTVNPVKSEETASAGSKVVADEEEGKEAEGKESGDAADEGKKDDSEGKSAEPVEEEASVEERKGGRREIWRRGEEESGEAPVEEDEGKAGEE